MNDGNHHHDGHRKERRREIFDCPCEQNVNSNCFSSNRAINRCCQPVRCPCRRVRQPHNQWW